VLTFGVNHQDLVVGENDATTNFIFYDSSNTACFVQASIAGSKFAAFNLLHKNTATK